MATATFFLSSTIYDLRDLRSALKYHLEAQGCAVLASEFNDFPKPLDMHSYEACLRAIHEADYFVLLIGSRVGGWYDKDNRISITQREYREAYERHRQGKMKLLIFVRGDVWQLRDDRNELRRHLDTLGIDPALRHAVLSHESKHATDADFICNFISEVSRNAETKNALDGRGPFPTGNWVHVFNSYADVADVLQSQAFAGFPVQEAGVRRLLKRELMELIRQALAKLRPGKVFSPTDVVELFHSEHVLERIDPDGPNPIRVSAKRWDMMSSFSINLLGRKFHTHILQRALESTAFLDYDADSGAFIEAPVYDALCRLKEEIWLLNRANTSETMAVVYEYSPRSRSPGSTVVIEGIKLIPFLHLMDRWVNVVELARSIVRHLDGAPLDLARLRPTSPIPAMNLALADEAVTIEEVQNFLATEVT